MQIAPISVKVQKQPMWNAYVSMRLCGSIILTILFKVIL